MHDRYLRVNRYVMADTGLGKEAGYENDAAMRDAVRAERAAMDPEVRAAIEEIERRFLRAALFGDDA